MIQPPHSLRLPFAVILSHNYFIIETISQAMCIGGEELLLWKIQPRLDPASYIVEFLVLPYWIDIYGHRKINRIGSNFHGMT